MFRTFLQNEYYQLESTSTEDKARLLLRIYNKPCRVYKNEGGDIAIYDGVKYFLVESERYVTLLDSSYSVCDLEPAEDCDVLRGYIGEDACFILTNHQFTVDRKLIIPSYNPYYDTIDCVGCKYEQFNGVLQIKSTCSVISFTLSLVGSEIVFEKIHQESA